MRFEVVLGGVLGVFGGVDVMAVSEVRVVRSSFMVSIGVMLCSFPVMARSVLVMVRCLFVMMHGFV